MKDILYITLKVQAAQNVSSYTEWLDSKKKIFLQLMVWPKPEKPDRLRRPWITLLIDYIVGTI